MFKSLTKSVLGIVTLPVAVAADYLTFGGLVTNRREPYTVTSFKQAMKNLELAFDPDDLTDEQVRELIRKLEQGRE